MFSDLIGPLTHTRDGITTVYGIVHGPGSFPECAATAIFTKVSGPEILNWITEVSGKLAKVCLSNTRFSYFVDSIKLYVFLTSHIFSHIFRGPSIRIPVE